MEIFGVIASLLGIGAEAAAQNDQKNLGWANLFETKRTNRKKEKLATSTREDAYGNEITYDPVLGWQINNTPMTQDILDSEQAETLASLTEDAGRNRNQARRKEERSLAASDDFEYAYNNYKYRPRKTEAEFIGDATAEKMIARRKGADETSAAVNKALIRQGNSSAIPGVFKAARDAEADEFEEALLGGKRQGRQDFYADKSAADGTLMQELEFLRGIANDTTQMSPRFTNLNEALSGMNEGALDQLIATIAQNDQSRQGATGQLMQVLGQSPNFAPLASAMGKLGGGMSGRGSAKVAGPVSEGESDFVFPLPREFGDRARANARIRNQF